MIKEKQFSFKRFGLLFKKHTVENYKGYLLSAAVMSAILGVCIAFTCYDNRRTITINQQIVYFVTSLLLSGSVFTSAAFSNLANKRKAIPAIMLPGTALEKYLVIWTYTFVIFQVVFIALFYGILSMVLNTGHLHAMLMNSHWHDKKTEMLNLFTGDEDIYYVYVAYAAFNAIALYGAIYFKKMQFIKTAFLVFCVGMFIWFVNIKVIGMMIVKPISNNPPFAGVSFTNTAGAYINLRMRGIADPWIIALFLVLSVIIWMAAYFRLKEKQV